MQSTIKSVSFACLCLIFLFSANSCRKDPQTGAKTDQTTQEQVIKKEAILNWMQHTPSMQLLELDWSRAKQTTMEGKNVVRIPTINIDRTAKLFQNNVQLNTLYGLNIQPGVNSVTSDIKGRNANYYSQHPPEVFFIEDNTSIHGFLLNFVPKDENKEFGQDNIWTGTLYEWNLHGDTVHIQDIEKSQLKERYAIKQHGTAEIKSQSNIGDKAIHSTSDKKIGRAFWDVLLDALADFIGWIGSAFGLSVHSNAAANGDINGGWRLQISFNWLTGSGGGGSGGGGSGYTGAGSTVYNAYILGYGDPSNGSWTMYPDGPSGSGPNSNGATYDATALYLFQAIPSLSPEQKAFLIVNPYIGTVIKSYLENHGPPHSNAKFASWMIDVLREDQPLNVYDFETNILNKPEVAQAFKGFITAYDNTIDTEDYLKWCAASLIETPNINDQLFVNILNNREGDNHFLMIVHNNLPFSEQQGDPLVIALTIHYSTQCYIIKMENPSWSMWRVRLAASKEIIHLMLDGIGLVPGAGEIADLTNGVIYTIEGNGTDATLSFASAIPFVGWFSTGVKFAKKGLNLANGTQTTLKWVVKAGDLINFGDRAQLRKVLGLAAGDAHQAHHLLPWAKQTHPVIQRASKAPNPFHMNQASNGIPLAAAQHLGSHANYDARVVQRMNDFINSFPNATPTQCNDALVDIISDIRTAIQNNPTTHINQLTF